MEIFKKVAYFGYNKENVYDNMIFRLTLKLLQPVL